MGGGKKCVGDKRRRPSKPHQIKPFMRWRCHGSTYACRRKPTACHGMSRQAIASHHGKPKSHGKPWQAMTAQGSLRHLPLCTTARLPRQAPRHATASPARAPRHQQAPRHETVSPYVRHGVPDGNPDGKPLRQLSRRLSWRLPRQAP